MAQGRDTDIQLSVGLSLEDVVAQTKKIANSVQKLFSNIDASKATTQMTKLQASMSKTYTQIQSTVLEIERLQEKQAGASRYEELGEDVLYYMNRIQELQTQIDSLNGTDVGLKKELEARIQGIQELMQPLIQEMAEIEIAGNSVFTDKDWHKLDTYTNQLSDLNNQQRINIEAFHAMEDQQRREAEAAAEAARAEQEHAAALQAIRDNAGEINPQIADSVNHLHQLAEEEERINARLAELREANVAEVGYQEYDQLMLRLRQIADEREQENQRVRQYSQQQIEAIQREEQAQRQLREEANQAAEEWARAQERAIAIINGDLNPEIAQMVDRYQQVGREIEHLEREQERLRQQGKGLGYTEYDNNVRQLEQLRHEYGELQNGIDQYAQSLSYEAQERQRLEAEAQQQIATARIENEQVAQMSNRYRELGEQISQLRQRRQELENRGTGAGYAEYDALTRQLGAAEREYDQLGHAIDNYNQRQSGATQATEHANSALGNLAKRGLTLISNRLQQFVRNITHATNATNKFGTSFKQTFRKILSYGLGIASITSLFNKIRGAIKENLKYFAQLNGGNNEVNASISQLMSSLNALKGALASAFIPIINVVSPILNNLISQLTTVINTIGMFIARLTGAKSYMMVSTKATDYASSSGKKSGSKGKSLEEKQAEVDKKRAKEAAKAEEKQAEAADKLAKAQKNANKQLAGFDELNELSLNSAKDLKDYTEKQYDDPTGGGSGGGAPFNMEEVELDDLEWDWDWLKKQAEKLGREFADKLNEVFKNEDLAKNIGHGIAELLNVGLHFAYGFVDQLNWKQMGRWCGTLIQEGLDTFEWDLLGTTIGKSLNGVANAIIGFFETYQVGTLGSSISTMIDEAVKETDPVVIGESVADILKAPLIELDHLLTDTNWKLLAEKLSTFFSSVLTSDTLNSQSLGEVIGQFIVDAVNVGFNLLLSIDYRELVSALIIFFGDIFRTVALGMGDSDWVDDLWKTFVEVLTGLIQGLVVVVGDLFIDLFKQAIPAIDAEQMKKDLRATMDAAGEEMVASLTNTMTKAEEQTERFNSAIRLMQDYMVELPSSFNSWGDAMVDLQKEYHFTNDEMDNLIEKFALQDDEFAYSDDILTGYTGDWETYKRSLLDVSPTLDETTEKQALFGKAVEDVGNSAETTSSKVTNYLKISDEQLEESRANAENYSTTTIESLNNVGEKSKDVKADFSDMSAQVQTQVDGLTQIINIWYEQIKLNYFGYDAWYNLINDSMVKGLEDSVDKMLKNYDAKMNNWKTGSITPMFNLNNWTRIFEPIKTAWNNTWTEIFKSWNIKFDSWWTADLVPAFEETKWKTQFNHIYTSANQVFTDVVTIIRQRMNQATSIVKNSCNSMADALGSITDAIKDVGDVLESLNEIDVSTKIKQLQVQVHPLAAGAVIPPNHKFLAMLGDQTHGTNIEAPLDTIKQAFVDALSTMNYNSNSGDTVIQIDGYEVFRAVRNQNERFRNSTGYDVL